MKSKKGHMVWLKRDLVKKNMITKNVTAASEILIYNILPSNTKYLSILNLFISILKVKYNGNKNERCFNSC